MTSTFKGFGCKNLGRKKSNPAWAFFIDLRDQGLPGIKCRHCDFASDDRSPLTMKYHIKKMHNTGSGGLWSILEEQYRLQAEGKLLVDFSTSSINTSAGQFSPPKSKRARNTKDSLNLSTTEDIDSKKGHRDLVKGNKPGCNISGDNVLDGNQEAPIPLQEGDGYPCSSLSSVLSQTQEHEEDISPSLTLGSHSDYVEPHRPRNSNLWIHLGRFDTEEEMHAVRSKQKVSKRRAEVMKHGTKIRYRCNRWKRTKCAYQMYAYFADSKIDLYESGEHDHSGEKLTQHLIKMQNRGAEGATHSQSIAKQLKLSQEDILNSLLRQATDKQEELVTINTWTSHPNVCSMQENAEEALPKMHIPEDNPTTQLLNMANMQFGLQQEAEKQAAVQLQLASASIPYLSNGVDVKIKASQLPPKFNLSEESNRLQLLELASELDMIVDFGKKSEFTFSSKSSMPENKSVQFVDQGECVHVANLHNQLVKATEEVWTKGDWSQFLWAVRGKCMHYLLTHNSSKVAVAPWHRQGLQARDKQRPSSPAATEPDNNIVI